MIAEGMGKKLKVVLAEMGIETDEEAQATVPSIIPLASLTTSSSSSSAQQQKRK